MTSSEVIQSSFGVFQALGWTLLRISAVPTLFCLAALTFVNAYVVPGFFETTHSNWLGQVQDVGVALAIGLAIGFPLVLMGVSMTTASVTQVVSDYMMGDVPDERAAIKAAQKRLPSLFYLSLRETLLSFSGFLVALLLFVASAAASYMAPQAPVISGLIFGAAVFGLFVGAAICVYFRFTHALASTVLILEGLKPGEAALRSKQLVKERANQSVAGTILGQILVSAFLIFILWFGLLGVDSLLNIRAQLRDFLADMPLSSLILQVYDLLPLYLTLWLVLPLWSATTTLLYYDRRIRLEGYDIEALAGDIWRAEKQSRFQL